jgi:hypothetical protein
MHCTYIFLRSFRCLTYGGKEVRNAGKRTPLSGRVNLTSKERVSDLFTKSKSPFIILVDAFLREGQGKILIVNKEHIVWVEPEED